MGVSTSSWSPRDWRPARRHLPPCPHRPEMAYVGFILIVLFFGIHILEGTLDLDLSNSLNWGLTRQARRALEVTSFSSASHTHEMSKAYVNVSKDMNYFVRAHKGHFVVGPECKPYYVSGWNQWEAMEAAAGVLQLYGGSLPTNMTGPQLVRSILDKAQSYGLNVLRTWSQPVTTAYALMPNPGEYNEAMWRGLDYLLAEARLRNIRVLLTITDNWQNKGTGGADDFMHWGGGEVHEDFFLMESVKQLYKDHAKVLLTRVNSITGVEYRNDPTIFAWNLINEPRCYLCDYDLKEWIFEMAEYIKSIDPNHMLTVGEEGFYQGGTRGAQFNPEANKGYPSWADNEGQNFPLDHYSPHIDFASIHLWLSNWEDVTEEFATQWLLQHARDAKELGKPLLLEEFGEWGTGELKKKRDYWYKFIYDTVAADAVNGGAFQGALFWQWFENGQVAPAEEGGEPGGLFGIFDTESTFDLVRAFSKTMKNLSMEKTLDIESCENVALPTSATYADCSKTWKEGVPGTGFEGTLCNIDVNECARGLDTCHEMASCTNLAGSYECKCFEGYTGDGHDCIPTKKLESIFSNYFTPGHGKVSCDEGQDLAYPSQAPGWAYDVTDSLNRKKNDVGRSSYGSRTPVHGPEDCMIACEMTHGCDSFSYSSDQRHCFLKSGASTKVCPKPDSLCVSVRGGTYPCGTWQTYFKKSAFSDEQMVEAFEGPPISPMMSALAKYQQKTRMERQLSE